MTCRDVLFSSSHLLKHQWLVVVCYSPGTPISSTSKTTCHDITEILLKEELNTITLQGSPHIVKTGWLDFSLSWLKGESEGKSGRLPKIDPNFNFSFPTSACPPTFHKTKLLHNDLKKDAINEFGIKYGSYFRNMRASFTWILKKRYDYWWTKYWLEKTDKGD